MKEASEVLFAALTAYIDAAIERKLSAARVAAGTDFDGLLVKHGHTLDSLSALTGVAASTLRRLRSGTGRPQRETLSAIARGLNVPEGDVRAAVLASRSLPPAPRRRQVLPLFAQLNQGRKVSGL